MNDFLELIRSRASIRAFTDEPLSEEMIRALEEAALSAPNGGNAQRWHFIFCTDQKRILALEADLVAGIRASGNEKIMQLQASRNWRIFFNAPLLIWITTRDGSAPVDAGIAGESMTLAAQSMGLGSCFIGGATSCFRSPKADYWRDLFAIPEGYDVHCGLAIGHPNMTAQPHALDFSKITRI